MKILITGSTGLVGSTACEFFAEKNWEVVGIDNNMRHSLLGTAEQENIYTTRVDIRNEGAINDLFQKHQFDAIIHAAGQASHDFSKENPMLDFYINTLGTMNLLEATRRWAPNATFIFVSSDKVYGGHMERSDLVEKETRWHSDLLVNESTPIDQTIHSPFGVAKIAADLYVQEYGYQYGIKTACFRCGCITGKNHQGAELHGFLAYLTKCIKEHKTYKIFGHKGKQVRDQIHAYDLANAFWHFIQNPHVAQVYNMGGGPERSVSTLEAIKLICTETNLTPAVEYVDKSRLGDPAWDIHDVSRFRADYPEWDYKYDLPAIIKDLCSTE